MRSLAGESSCSRGRRPRASDCVSKRWAAQLDARGTGAERCTQLVRSSRRITGRSAPRPPTFRNPARANVDARPVYHFGSFVEGYASTAGAPASRAKRIAAASSAELTPCRRYPRRTKKQDTDQTGR